jgi:hypothetical protein
MNTPSTRNMDKESAPTPIFEPFPKPQTMPAGWDLSGFDSTPSLPAVTGADAQAES